MVYHKFGVMFMFAKIIDILKKYNSLFTYALFGVCTTIINILAFYLFYNFLEIENVPSNIIAWVLAVLFAFITNKLFVFKSKSMVFKTLIKESISFFTCRFLTGVLDILIMYFAVDVFFQNSTMWKIVSNIIVIVLNYIVSKLFVFNKKWVATATHFFNSF